MGRVSGIDEIRLRYTEEFVIETNVNLLDGKPMAYKVRPLKPMALFSMGLTWPMSDSIGTDRDLDKVEEQKMLEGITRVVARSIVAARETEEGEDGVWEERWTPVEVVCDRPINPDAVVRELRVEEIDYSDTITRIWNEMSHRFQLQQGNGGTPPRGTEPPRTRKPRRARRKVGKVAARTGARKK
jgi:hypothetical protein